MGEKISVTDYEYRSDRVPLPFDGFKIAAVSDLHCKKSEKIMRFLLTELKVLSLISFYVPEIWLLTILSICMWQ